MKRNHIVALLSFLPVAMHAYVPTNMSWAYDMPLLMQPVVQDRVALRVWGEYAYDAKGFDENENKVNPAQIYGAQESALAMLEGHSAGMPLNLLANRIGGLQNGVRGMFTVTGDYAARTTNIETSLRLLVPSFPGVFNVTLTVPFVEMGFKNIVWTSKTAHETLSDDLVNSQIAHDQTSLAQFTQEHGNLDITDHYRQGLGDIAAMLHWTYQFSHYQRRLRNVVVALRAGVSAPTGHKNNSNQSFDSDFGHDGAFGAPLGARLEMELDGGISIGADVAGTILARRTKDWRVKTSWAQTEHLLLTTARATREYGPEWKFTLFTQIHDLGPGFMFGIGYQFLKHTESTLYPQEGAMSASLLNSSQTVEASQAHSVLVDARFVPQLGQNWRLRPTLHFTAKIPVNGKRVIGATTLGGGIGFQF